MTARDAHHHECAAATGAGQRRPDRVPRRLQLACALIAVTLGSAPHQLRAQEPAMRFQTVESYRLAIQTPYGVVGITISGSSDYNVRPVTADSLVLTFTRMDVEQFCVCGYIRVDTRSLVGKPIALRLEPNGRVRVLSGIRGDVAGAHMTDPASAFGGTLFRFPQSLLAVGTQWADSATDRRGDGSRRGQDAVTVQRSGRYRVDADTTIDGTRAWLIAVQERLRQTDQLRSAQTGVEGTMSLEGDDTGWVAVAQDGSGIVRRVEHAALEGMLHIPSQGSTGAKAVRVRLNFDVTLTRLP